jgi:hypothetical protein
MLVRLDEPSFSLNNAPCALFVAGKAEERHTNEEHRPGPEAANANQLEDICHNRACYQVAGGEGSVMSGNFNGSKDVLKQQTFRLSCN